MFQTPILFLIFNRLETTKIVFEHIKKQKPKYLFISADGPRKNKEGEKEKCKEIQNWVLANIDWDCILETRFLDTNEGCGKHVSGAITWFFEHVEMGIILEDDCVPNYSFFKFCEQLLDMYKHNHKVYMIGGNNFQISPKHTYSYYFSTIGHIWGWATWRRAWQKYDFTLQYISDKYFKKQANNFFKNSQMVDFWYRTFKTMKYTPIDTWDYQWSITLIVHGGLAITPYVNLVSNIGFNADATHTISYIDGISNLQTHELQTIVHPSKITINRKADLFTFYKIFERKKKNMFIKKCKDKLKYEYTKIIQRFQ
jgi:hypothetical protein